MFEILAAAIYTAEVMALIGIITAWKKNRDAKAENITFNKHLNELANKLHQLSKELFNALPDDPPFVPGIVPGSWEKISDTSSSCLINIPAGTDMSKAAFTFDVKKMNV